MDTIEVYKDESDPPQWRWRRESGNHELVSTSGESFEQRSNAERAARREAEGTDAEVIINEGEDS